MSEHVCERCSAPLPSADATRCRACGAVRGEDNYCASCGNHTPVQARYGGAYACILCGANRTRGPGTVVVNGDLLGLSRNTQSGLVMAGGAGGIAMGVLGAVAAVAVLGVPGLLFGGVSALVGVGGGLGLIALGRRARREAPPAVGKAELVALAEEHGGALYTRDVARAFKLEAEAAEQALTAITDGTEVDLEVTDDGELRWVFTEVRRRADASPRVRVEDAEEVGVLDESAEAEAKQTLER